MGRLIFWATAWFFAMLLGFIVFAWGKFIDFWIWVWNKLVYIIDNFIPYFIKNIFPFIKEHGGEIWLVIAAIGSLYGIVYVTLKRRATKRNIPFYGVFGFLKRKKNKQTVDNRENKNGTGSSEISM